MYEVIAFEENFKGGHKGTWHPAMYNVHISHNHTDVECIVDVVL